MELYGFMLIHREITAHFKLVMEQFSVVTILGPRQSGKTTLVKMNYPDKPYFNLEEPDIRALLQADPRKFFADNPNGVILDEIQRVPDLISYIQVIVDKAQKPGMFILTGSHQLQLHEAISQSLAGRTAILDLYPFSLHELSCLKMDKSLDQMLLDGFFPAIYSKKMNSTLVHRNYIKTYLERDVRQILNIKNLDSFQRFIQLCAGRIGGVLSIEGLSNDVGMTSATIKNWLSVLGASFITQTLQPYYENFGKRVIKSPKLYFADVGQASYLLGLEEATQVSRDRLRGSLFENLVLLELIKSYKNSGKEPYLYYYRDNHQNEVDIIVKVRHALIPIEIKSTSTFNISLLNNLRFYQSLVGERMPMGFLVYAGEQEQKIGNFYVMNYKNIGKIYDLCQNV